jgi:AhpD family alkylhydroperoxidase
MIRFEAHTIDTAPERSKPLLQELQESIGMIPNLAATMAESPELLEGFLRIRSIFNAGSFSPGEVQVLALTNAFENGCTYCMALHSVLALKAGVSREAVDALREGRAPVEPRLAALSEFSRTLVRTRGHVTARDLSAFVSAGFTRAQALEAVLGVAVSILPNFAHHVTQCPIDDAFRSQTWEKPAA